VEQDGKLSFHFRRYTCVDCHVPQANVDVLVDNVFSR
jgi:nitrate reductase cytochrome c-type subunit